MTTVQFEKSNGPALAAIVAAGLGVLVLGLCTLLAEVSTATNNANIFLVRDLTDR